MVLFRNSVVMLNVRSEHDAKRNYLLPKGNMARPLLPSPVPIGIVTECRAVQDMLRKIFVCHFSYTIHYGDLHELRNTVGTCYTVIYFETCMLLKV